ncbi:MAG: hypothetical protein HY720_32485 [Planctomycetes bacterium]|nr:hypothetical protein [Planctomycetota bacterium]
MNRTQRWTALALCVLSPAWAGEPEENHVYYGDESDASTGMNLSGGFVWKISDHVGSGAKGIAFTENFPLYICAYASMGRGRRRREKPEEGQDYEPEYEDVPGRAVVGAGGLHLADHLSIEVKSLDRGQAFPIRLRRMPFRNSSAELVPPETNVLEFGHAIAISWEVMGPDGGPFPPGTYQIQITYDTRSLPRENPIHYVYLRTKPEVLIVKSTEKADPLERALARIAYDWHRRPIATWEAIKVVSQAHPDSMHAAAAKLGYLVGLGAFEKAMLVNRELVARMESGSIPVDRQREPIPAELRPNALDQGLVGTVPSPELEAVLRRLIRMRDGEEPAVLREELRFLREQIGRILAAHASTWDSLQERWNADRTKRGQMTVAEYEAHHAPYSVLQALLAFQSVVGEERLGGLTAELQALIDELLKGLYTLREGPPEYGGPWESLESMRTSNTYTRGPLLEALRAAGGLPEDMRATLSPKDLEGDVVRISPGPSNGGSTPRDGERPRGAPRRPETSSQGTGPTWLAVGLLAAAVLVLLVVRRSRA